MTVVDAAPLEGGCACGAVRFRAQGAPKRAGICHCRTCQKVHGSAFYAFAIFERDQVLLSGDTQAWRSTPGYTRLACAMCGSRIGGLSGSELELSLPLFDVPVPIEPQYESWVSRRVAWMPALPIPQYPQNRVAPL